MLLERQRMPVADAVRRVGALQAQEPASPYLALWNRLHDLQPADVDAAFRSHEVVKATLMRITLHAVADEDRPAFRLAMRPTLRAAGLDDRRFTSTGLTVGDADALVAELTTFATEPRARADVEAHLATHLGTALDAGVWRALRMIAPLVHAPGDAPWSFDRTARFVARDDGTPGLDRDEATARLIRRYLAAFGPASRKDFARFTMLRQADTRSAWERLRPDLVTMEGPAGTTLHDLPGAPLPDEDVAAPPRLLPMWDSVLLAYADRTRLIPDAYRRHLIRRNGDVLPAVLVDGAVAGSWRHVEGGIEVAAFHTLADEAWDGLAEEARRLVAFLDGRDEGVYARYAHWWPTLPAEQVVRPA
jgi:hypothetical protein